ncbi:hypothetical protein J5N97_018034 [Dioscorea zingiberensis]|uniref:Uncharacterized protein n=1 Tax=Dioscorea zingiberensis TaxID=325984 RepID=A0A9D5HGW8_9LILI|nr:hypothetical protein J5N97_018034 [Dioscorea zingiberensis]
MPGMWQLDVPPNQVVAVGERLFSSGDCLNAWKGHVEEYDGKLGIWNVVERSQSDEIDRLSAEMEERVERVYLTMGAIGRSHMLGNSTQGRSMYLDFRVQQLVQNRF